ncbi:MAG: hypothetical protein DRP47_10250 [Candidatus Zixiibacteriota bacterium]|nr:MAG: hypothetical protein DRP47_10250 [candidate division Zixibacteria bacterium]
MKVKVSYAGEKLSLHISEETRVDSFAPRMVEESLSFDVFRNELEQLARTPQFQSSRLLTVVNDGHRNTPTSTLIDWLSRIDETYLGRTDFLVATGTHEPPTEDHYHKIFGPFLDKVRNRVHYHSAIEDENLFELGTDSMGEKVYINKMVRDYPAILAIGSVEPHYFAGFTGGRKSFFPGLSDMATTVRNHNMASSLDAAPLRLDGNPVAEHMQEIIDLLPLEKIIALQTVHGAENQLAGCYWGSLAGAFQQAIAKARKIFVYQVNKVYDIILAEILPPLDSNLYQAQKALENCQSAIKDGGAIIIFSECGDGIGSRFFYDLAKKWDRKRNAATDGKQYFGSHKLARVNLMSRRINIYLHSSLKPEEIRRVFYEPLDNPQDFIYSRVTKSKKSNIAVVHDAAHTVLCA